MSKIAETLISGLFGGAQAGASILANKNATAEYYEHQSELMNQQNEWNQDMWHKQNLYNSPANMRKLLNEGGFNPDLMYAKGGFADAAPAQPAATGNAIMPDYQTGITQGFSSAMQMPSTLSSYIGQNLENDRKAMENDVFMTTKIAELDKIKEDTRNVRIKNNIDKITYNWSEKMQQQAFDTGELQKEGQRITNDVVALQKMQESYNTYMRYLDAKNYKDKTKKDLLLLDKQILLAAKNAELTDKQIGMIQTQIQILGPQLLSAEGQQQLRQFWVKLLGPAGAHVLYEAVDFGKNLAGSVIPGLLKK